MCVYVCMCGVCVCSHMCVRGSEWVGVCACVHGVSGIRMLYCVCMCRCEWVHVHMRVCARLCVHVCMWVGVHVCMWV